MAEFVMPKLGADMTAGKLVAWRKKPGDAVRHGEIIAEVETEKGVIEVEVFLDGTIEKLLVEPGTKVPVGTALALLKVEGETVTAHEPVRQRSSPAARELARVHGVNIADLQGSGPGGAITREDVERATSAKPVDADLRMRQAIAAAMTRSKREIPHYYLSTTIDLQSAMHWLSERNSTRPVTERLLPGVLFIKATALALKDFPELNGTWNGDRLIPNPDIHVGIAIALRRGGLIAPAIHNADRLALNELMTRLQDLVSRARAGSLRSSELTDPTITVTSLGDRGAEAVWGVIHPPQTAIVGFGRIVERPWVVDGQVLPRSIVTATLSGDHRASDGHRGGLFLAAIERILQEPDKL